jgi:hypothetical protein
MYLEIGGKGAHGRKCLTGLKLAADEGLLRSEYDLIENRLAGPKLKAEWCHIDNVTRVTVPVKSVF